MLRMEKILVGTEDTVIIAVGKWVDRSSGDCVEGREDEIPEGSLKGICKEL